jgi:hypothetical protein
VRRSALKKLFQDPHFNVMDGLDTYIGDYNTPDPLPDSMLKELQFAKDYIFKDPTKSSSPRTKRHCPSKMRRWKRLDTAKRLSSRRSRTAKKCLGLEESA